MLQLPAASIFLLVQRLPHADQIGGKSLPSSIRPGVAPPLQFNSTGGVDVVYGIDRGSFARFLAASCFFEGHDWRADDLLVDDWAAKAKHINWATPTIC